MLRIQTLICAAVMSLGACCARRPKPVQPVELVRYLPSPSPSPCVRRPPPAEPSPPRCTDPSTPTNSCSETELAEYTATLLDHRESLASWSSLTWKVCGP